MKSRFSTIDITSVIRELLRFISMRVMNVYDIDNKTYLIRLGKPDDKAVILMESGIKLHSTEFDWPKNPAPSGFSMKMRKHLKNRRLESVQQLGVDRIVDLTFGSGEAAYHVILELYDRGNIVLTDCTYTILNILRPRTDNEDVRFAVREIYPIDAAKLHTPPTEERLRELVLAGKPGDPLKKILIPHLDYGPAIIEHCLLGAGFPEGVKIGKGFDPNKDMFKLLIAIEEAEDLLTILQTQPSSGYIIEKREKRPTAKEGEPTELLTYDEFHPMLFRQHEKKQYKQLETFNKAVDEFYSQMESQKMELKTLQQEKSAWKKLENIKKDLGKRVEGLQQEQEVDKMKGQLIEMNLDLVDRAIRIVVSAIANQIDWTEIHNLVKEAQMDEDPVAMAIKDLKLSTNHITLWLTNPYVDSDFEEEEDDYNIKPMKVDIDLSMSAYANSRKYFEKKKHAAVKEQKTVDASTKAFKSAERKTKETLKDVATAASINKARKTYWFEKFLWFISSENFLVIGGRDQQQNELIVKRHLKQNDIYVHADLHGASSVIIQNNTSDPVPPKTLNEAGTMAICNSAAWDAKVVTSAWWVYPSQVSKTAPSGEYLTTGSFMIRGKKNFLPPSYLIYGFGFLFKLEEGSVARHEGERKIRTAEDDDVVSIATESEVTMDTISDIEEEESDNESDQSQDSKNEINQSEDTEVEIKLEDTEETESVSQEVKSEVKVSESCDSVSDSVESVEGGIVIEKHCAMGQVIPVTTKAETKPAPAVVEFPDTEISLQHVTGDKYSLARSTSNQSTDYEPIYLGDDEPITFGDKPAPTQGNAKVTAKQRREMKKAKKQQQQGLSPQKEDEENRDDVTKVEEAQPRSDEAPPRSEEAPLKVKQKVKGEDIQQQEQLPQAKRRQKAKMKKMKDKYGDQDDEERQLRMEILASAGTKKEDKKKKGKKGIEKGPNLQQQKQQQKQQQQQQQKNQGYQKLGLVDIVVQDIAHLKTEDVAPGDSTESQVAKETLVVKEVEDDDTQETDTPAAADDLAMLTSLTGIPVTEDELLYAVPVCAPYNALTNYKYKVKLLPGSTKRGKAAKLAINMHLHDKSVTGRERDLLKIMKDVDISRNIPGKVKVSAPNLSKAKKK